MAASEPYLDVIHGAKVLAVRKKGTGWKVRISENGRERNISAHVLVDATELGDIAASCGVPYHIGMDSRDHTGESIAPENANDVIQDLTYVAILKDYGKGADMTVPRPDGYDPSNYANSATGPASDRVWCDGSEIYKAETGKDVPASYNDADWVEWRLEKLNSFGKRLYDEVKKADPELLVSFSPNPYPWCMQNLMQDWPSWLEGGYVDILSVQCYRETEESYRNTLEEAVGYVKASTDKNVLNPGIYLRSGDAWGSVFASQMLINREFGTNGEAFFFNEGLGQEVNREVIKAFYTGKAVFPTEF